MSKLFLLRHLKSQWNFENRFAGWMDNPLSVEGKATAQKIALEIGSDKIEVVYTSPLIRNMETVLKIFEYRRDKYPLFLHTDGGKMQRWGNFSGNENHIPVYVSQTLNERYYGDLQGLNKQEIIDKYGEEKVHKWRRGFKDKPPRGESLKDVCNRALPFFKKYIENDLMKEKNVLVVASHNSLRALVKYIENISDQEVSNLELPFGGLTKYIFDKGEYIK